MNVSIAEPAFGTCSGSAYSATWIGIDGYTNSSLMQAGTEADESCSGNSVSANYYAWYEWLPESEIQIANFPVKAGDIIHLQIAPTVARWRYTT